MEVPQPLNLDLVSERLARYTPVAGPLSVEAQSASSTRARYIVTDGAHRWVIRRPLSAVALDRLVDEDALLTLLSDSSIPVPLLVVPAEAADGQFAFDAVALVDGHRVRGRLPIALPRNSTTRHDLSAGMVDVLIRLHNLDPADVGLDHIAPQPLGERLAATEARWVTAGITSAPTDDLRGRLHTAMPPAASISLTHGRFHLSNLLFERDEPRRVAAILGWEYSGVGDPLCDLGSLLALWAEDVDEPVTSWLPWTLITADDGFFSRSTVTHEYMVRSRHDLRHIEWYVGLGYLELIVLAAEDGSPEALESIHGMAVQALTRADHSGISGLATR